jgi:hypothetical protein
MNLKTLTIALSFASLIISCKKATEETIKDTESESESTNFQNKGQKLVYDMVKKVGTYQMLQSKKDVVYTYTYTTPDGKSDISTEKYFFDGELSYGEYQQHQRTLPELEGKMEQGYDGQEYWLKIDGKVITDSLALKQIEFSRPTNFYWFAMFQKLLDPGLKYDYLGEKDIENKKYDVVKVSFEPKNDKPTDVYQLYINKESGLVDQFLFTVADKGVVDTPLLMQVEYEKVDGFLIPSKRKYKKSSWEAEVTDTPWIQVTWANIHFTNGLKKGDFTK